jgi:hypothetical protein
MSYKWRNKFFDKTLCQGEIINNLDGNIVVKGKLKIPKQNVRVVYWASNPPDGTYSFSAAGMPYPSPEIAFENTVNKGSIISDGDSFEFKIYYPNSYYVGQGSLYMPPHVFVKICDPEYDNVETIQLGPGIPFRTLTPPGPPTKNHRNSPLFYYNESLKNMDVRTQEQILRDSGYPVFDVIPPKMPDNFWGLRPTN